VPASLEQWRKARAEVAHDWLERGLLPVLNTPGDTPEDFSRRANLCLEDWINEVVPRLEAMIALLPGCFLPGSLLRGQLEEAAIECIDNAALDTIVGENLLLRNVAAKLRGAATGAGAALENYSLSPDDSSRLQAFAKITALRLMMQQAPKTVILP
jgi:hypothetical protein